MMRCALPLLALAGALGLAGCATPVRSPSKETTLRELYFFTIALPSPRLPEAGFAPDTVTFRNFATEVTADTVRWNLMQASWKRMRADFSGTLGQLGYGTGPFTWEYGSREEAALSHFQHDLAIPVTGRLDSLTVLHLVRADKALNMTDVKLPLLIVSRHGNYFFATGTWKAITNKLYYPVNTVDIVCDVGARECEVTEVDFISDELDQIEFGRRDLTVTSVDGDLLVARSSDITLTINVPAKEVVWSQARDPGLQTGDASQTTMRLVSGRELSPPFDGGDLKAEHSALFKDREQYLALRTKNMTIR